MGRKPPTGICKLCLKTSKLKESHIISKLFWNGSGIFRELKYFEAEAIAGNGPTLRNQQDGFKEYMLCSDCEVMFSKWETYGNKVFFGANGPFTTRPSAPRILLASIDYAPFKLLTMSILWRMAVTAHPYYDRVNMDAKDIEELRTLLLAANPGEPSWYPCSFTILVNDVNTLLPALFSPAARMLLKNYPHTVYAIIIAGVHWLFFASKHADQNLSPCFIQRNGEIWLRVATPDSFKYMQPHLDHIRNRHQFPPSSIR